MRKGYKYKNDDSRQREQAHWFGAEGGNARCPLSVAREQRLFYKWVLTEATERELQDYLSADDVPYARKKFIKSILNAVKVNDFCEITNQIYGIPKQQIEVQNLPPINLQVFDVPEGKQTDV